MSQSKGREPRYVVVQVGARREYMVPEALANQGLLSRCYTDLCANLGLGNMLVKSPLKRLGPMNRLSQRIVPDRTLSKVRSSALFSLLLTLSGKLSFRFPRIGFLAQLVAHRFWAKVIEFSGFDNASHLYVMLTEGGPITVAAKRQGLVVVVEVLIMISTEKRVQEERLEYPDWESPEIDWPKMRKNWDATEDYLRDLDYLVCPSANVIDDLVTNWGISREKCKLVPYGMAPRWLSLTPDPALGRVLFVGSAGLRKGIHYLALAAKILRSRGRNYDFRVAGGVSGVIADKEECSELRFLGRIPRSEIMEEYKRADVFVLPSLAEGSAEVTYEALGAGVPQIVTRAAGSVIEHGVQGYIVREGDASSLADRIEEIVENRSLRARMSNESKMLAAEYIWPKYGDRLVHVLRGL